tara:strand:+ start:61 stop:453 length:393 start_codon:yes stop_codon:yes gene_type:complete
MSIINSSRNYILAPISLGELIDKITILEIKKDKILSKKRLNVVNELEQLRKLLHLSEEINSEYIHRLKEVNLDLWDIEDRLRIKEAKNEFDHEFIDLARSVYLKNDKRYSIKSEINNQYKSLIIEEKSYK